MGKNYNKCPRCGNKTASNFPKCGVCGLNFKKFATATNSEAKSAIRMGERDRVLYSTTPPYDINKTNVLIMAIFGGWCGIHYFSIGRFLKGIFQIIGFIFGMIYCVYRMNGNSLNGFIGNLVLVLGIIWVITILLWITDIVKIIFNKFKYPVSLPYSNKNEKGE